MVDDAYVKQLEDANWPQEFHEKLHIGNLKSNIGIATLWTFQEVVYKNVDPKAYAVIGNYYDRKNALEPLIRNCLANPNIRHIILVGNDKAQSREVLVNFFEKGIKDGKVVDTECTIPELIPQKDIEELRKNVVLHDLVDDINDLDDSTAYADAIHGAVKKCKKKDPYAKPRLYDKPKLSTDNFPSEKVGIVLRNEKIGALWLQILRTIYDYGVITKMKEKDSTQVRVFQNLVAVISGEDPDDPKMEEYFRFDKKYLKDYYDEICTDKIPEGTLYTYGSRLRAWEGKDGKPIDQIADIIAYLKEDPYRASGIAQTWVVEDELTRRILNKDKNSPCIVLAQAYAPEGELTLTVYIRSNDMFRAWPLNMFGLRKLQKNIADGLSMKMGSLTTISCSAQIYQDNWNETKEILEKYFTSTNCFYDPRGYYVITVTGGVIHAKHFSPDSKPLKEYEGKTARELNDAINSSQHPVDPYHSSYLGEEFMKAEVAAKLGITYTQDAPLDLSSIKKSIK
tara:strand:- start:10413 stop:11942 length:1530 start_codon:yes stop_codon:yes gene_type:complete